MKKFSDPCCDCPKAGDVYVCEVCQMTALVAKDCGCTDCNCVCLACCGQAMTKVNAAAPPP